MSCVHLLGSQGIANDAVSQYNMASLTNRTGCVIYVPQKKSRFKLLVLRLVRKRISLFCTKLTPSSIRKHITKVKLMLLMIKRNNKTSNLYYANHLNWLIYNVFNHYTLSYYNQSQNTWVSDISYYIQSSNYTISLWITITLQAVTSTISVINFVKKEWNQQLKITSRPT